MPKRKDIQRMEKKVLKYRKIIEDWNRAQESSSVGEVSRLDLSRHVQSAESVPEELTLGADLTDAASSGSGNILSLQGTVTRAADESVICLYRNLVVSSQ